MQDSTPLAILGIILLVILAIWILYHVVSNILQFNNVFYVLFNILLLLVWVWIIYVLFQSWRDGEYKSIAVIILLSLFILSLPEILNFSREWI